MGAMIKKPLLFMLFLAGTLALTYPARASETPELRKILKSHVDAMGGWKNWSQIGSIRQTGTIEREGQTVDFCIVKKRPNMIRATLTMAIPGKEDEAVQVIRAHDGRVLWSYQIDTMIEDIFAVQDEIANNVAQNLKSTLYREALRINAALRTDNLAAYDAYLLALKYHPTNWPLVVENARKAVELDPDFVPAHTLLADAYLRRVGGNMEFATAYPLARSSAERALTLAPPLRPSCY